MLTTFVMPHDDGGDDDDADSELCFPKLIVFFSCGGGRGVLVVILLQLLLSLLLPQFCAVTTAFSCITLCYFSFHPLSVSFIFFIFAFHLKIPFTLAFVVIAVVVMTFNTFKRF